MLYTVNKSPWATNSLESVLRVAQEGSPILLYEDGVYAAISGAKTESLVQSALDDHPVYALEEDLEARGIQGVMDGIQLIGYDGFVTLVEEHNVAPWL